MLCRVCDKDTDNDGINEFFTQDTCDEDCIGIHKRCLYVFGYTLGHLNSCLCCMNMYPGNYMNFVGFDGYRSLLPLRVIIHHCFSFVVITSILFGRLSSDEYVSAINIIMVCYSAISMYFMSTMVTNIRKYHVDRDSNIKYLLGRSGTLISSFIEYHDHYLYIINIPIYLNRYNAIYVVTWLNYYSIGVIAYLIETKHDMTPNNELIILLITLPFMLVVGIGMVLFVIRSLMCLSLYMCTKRYYTKSIRLNNEEGDINIEFSI